jgi:hypothetical protein
MSGCPIPSREDGHCWRLGRRSAAAVAGATRARPWKRHQRYSRSSARRLGCDEEEP